MNYTAELNKQFYKATRSRKFELIFSAINLNNSHKITDKDIVEFSKIKVNVEKEKIDKYVPNRYIPKIGDNGKMYKMLDVIAKDELKYLQYTHKEYLKNRRFDESKCQKLNLIKADVAKQEVIFKDMIFKGIKSDIETIGLYRHEPEKTNLKAIDCARIEGKLLNQALIDISNFTGQDCYSISYQIEEIYNNNNKIVRNQKQIDEIGFWKGNFFGTKDEKQLYLSSKNENVRLENSINIIYDSIKDKIDETIHISTLVAGVDSWGGAKPATDFVADNFKGNAILHANTEIALKNEIDGKHDNEVPKFLIDRDFSKNVDSEQIGRENTEQYNSVFNLSENN